SSAAPFKCPSNQPFFSASSMSSTVIEFISITNEPASKTPSLALTSPLDKAIVPLCLPPATLLPTQLIVELAASTVYFTASALSVATVSASVALDFLQLVAEKANPATTTKLNTILFIICLI